MGDGVTAPQAGALVLNAVLGVGILSLAAPVAEAAGTGAWLSILLAGLVATAATGLVARLVRTFPGMSLTEYASLLWGAWTGPILAVVYALYHTALVVAVLRTFADFTAAVFLFQTPDPVTILAMLLVVAYAGRMRLSAFAAFHQFLVWVTVGPAIILFAASLTAGNLELLQPPLSRGWAGVLAGLRPASFAYLGFEILLFLGARVQKPAALGLWTMLGMAVVVLFYTGAAVISLTHLGPDFVAALSWPLLNAAGAIMVPGEIIERPELLVAVVWVGVSFTTASAGFMMARLALESVVRRGSPLAYVLALSVPIYVLSLVPRTAGENQKAMDMLGIVGAILAVGIPVLLLVAARLRGWRAVPGSSPGEG